MRRAPPRPAGRHPGRGPGEWGGLREAGAPPEQTVASSPFFTAPPLVGKDRARFGLDALPAPPLEFDVVEVPRPIALARVAREIGSTTEALRSLNGELRRPTTPHGVARYPLRVPKGAGPILEARLESIPAAPEVRERRLKVRKGDTLARFAKRNHVTVAALREANGLRPNAKLRAGQLLVVPGRYATPRTPAAELAEAADAPVLPEMERGEIRALPTPSAAVVDAATLGADLPGVSVAPLPSAPLPSRVEIPRDGFEAERVESHSSENRAAARTKPAARRTKHTVRRGETLFRIANRYGVTVDALRRANRIGRGHVIRPGQKLAVPTATR